MKTKFVLPATSKCKVIYVRENVTYQAITDTPRSNDELQRFLLTRKVGMSQVQRVEAIEPPRDLHRPHPAMRALSKYATTSEH